VIATLTFEVRLALPVSELFQLFLERHPTEKRHIEEISTRRALETAAVYEEGVLVSYILPYIHTYIHTYILYMYTYVHNNSHVYEYIKLKLIMLNVCVT
jgi:hypothetical protein